MFKNIFTLLISCAVSFGQNMLGQQEIQKQLERAGISASEASQIIEKEMDGKSDVQSIQTQPNDQNRIENNIKSLNSIEKSINEVEIKEFEDFEGKKSEKSKDVIGESDNNENELEEDKNEDKNGTISLGRPSLAHFGYNIFDGDPEIFQQSIETSIDPNYLIGYGDEVILMLWGETQFSKNYIVSRDGYLFIENIGQVFVNGLTLEKLESKLFRVLKKVYSSLDPKNGSATTFFDVSLGSLVLRPLRVFALGEVEQPGAYNVKSSTSLFTSIYYY